MRGRGPSGRRLGGVALTAVLVLIVMSASAKAGPLPMARATSPVSSPWFGATVPGLPTDVSELDALSASVGTRPTVAMWYAQWATATNFPASAATQLAGRGVTPEITWEPWDAAAGVDQPLYRLQAIAGGAFDAYLTRWARQIRSWGKPLRIRFAHEMNGTWYPWAEGVNGNPAGSYAATWRHVHAVFAAQKATNVTWVWSPNVPFAGSAPLSELYPGDDVVDEVALDGYNWGASQAWSSWQSPTEVFGVGLAQLRQVTSRPISLGEIASAEAGGDKAAWIADMFTALRSWSDVRGFVWFDFAKETDWRIDSSAPALSAFSTGVRCYTARIC